MGCTSLTHLTRVVLPTRTSSITTSFNKVPKCPREKNWKRQPSPILCLKQSKKHLHIKQNLYFDEPSPFSIQPSQNTKLNENVTTKAFFFMYSVLGISLHILQKSITDEGYT